MKVLQIANGYLDKALYRNLFDHMDREAVQNVVFVPVAKGDKREAGRPDILVRPCFSSLDRWLYFRKQEKTFRAIVSALGPQLDGFALTHSHTLFSTGCTSLRLKRKFGIPYVVAVRNTDVNLFFARFPFMRGLGNTILKEAEKIVFLSPAYADFVLERYVRPALRDEIRAKTAIIPNGISDFFFEAAPRAPKSLHEVPMVIHVGDIDRNKNVLATLAAIEKLRAAGEPFRFVLVGAPKDLDIVATLRAKDFVQVLPKCDHREVIGHYSQADILVMPSFHETFGLVYAEAMSQGVPVVYTRNQGFDGQFPDGEAGYAVASGSPDEIAAAIANIKHNYSPFSANCLSLSRRFDWNAIAREYETMYAAIARKGAKCPLCVSL